jgi:pyruvate/2-oxoglutarate dehydrogenase complex dihydrolipoamide dehydrogenase (E3) component
MKYDYDLIVIGAGSAGLFAASIANTLGAKTCLIEKRKLGGDCTWFGCVPSKALLKSAKVAHTINDASRFGLNLGDLNLDTDKVMSHVRGVIDEVAKEETPEVFEKRGITVIIGSPQFIDSNTIEINSKQIRAKKFIICTGSHPLVIPIEGLEGIDYLTNESIFSLDKLPDSLLVLGGGPIGVELSQALSRLGVKVTIIEMMDRILFREEEEIASVVEEKLISEGIFIVAGKKAISFNKKDGKVYVTVEDKHKEKEELSADNVLVAVGRAPNISGLGLEKAGVEYNNKVIVVNAYLQTTNKNIFAAGDIASPYQFTHVAAYQATVAVRNALFKRLAWQKASYENIVWATFTDPEIVHLGLTESEARKKYKNIRIYTNDYTSSDRATTDREKDGFVKIVTDKKGFVLGAHISGAQASEIIQGLILAKSLKIPLAKLAPVLYIYPTLSQIVNKTAAKNMVEKINNPLIKFLVKLMRKK